MPWRTFQFGALLALTPGGLAAGEPQRKAVDLPIGEAPREANGLTKKILTAKPPCMELHVGLSQYEKQGDLDSSNLYGPAKYRQAWCFIAAGDWTNARRALARAFRLSREEIPGTTVGSRKALRQAVMDDLVWLYPKLSEAKAAEAYIFFAQLAGDDKAVGMAKQLGEVYWQTGEHEQATVLYRDMRQRLGESPRAITFAASLLAAARAADPAVDQRADVRILAELLRSNRQRGEKRDREGEALGEEALRHATLRAHLAAKKITGKARPEALARVAELYAEYLALFGPDAGEETHPNGIFLAFYLAQVDHQRGRLQKAATSYDKVAASAATSKNQKARDLETEALAGSALAHQEAVQKKESAAPPRFVPGPKKPLAAPYQEFVAAIVRFLDRAPQDDPRRFFYRYQRGRVRYTFNDLEAAAGDFTAVLAHEPRTQVSCFAARLLLDILHRQGDLVKLRDTATQMRGQSLPCGAETLSFVATIEQRTALQIIKRELEDQNRDQDAAAAYLFFFETHRPRLSGRLGAIALFNAAVLLDRAGETDEARATRQTLMALYPAEEELVRRAKAKLERTPP